jgi:hypothetical protein
VNLILALCEYRIASLESACESAIQKPCDLSTAFPILVRLFGMLCVVFTKHDRESRFIHCGLLVLPWGH